MNNDKQIICVDLDGTLIVSDTLWELFLRMLKHCPWILIALPFWLLGGIANLKVNLSKRFAKYINKLPFNDEFLTYLKEAKANGDKLYLATACEESLAKKIVEPLDLFDEVFATTPSCNLKSGNKAKALIEKFGDGNFVYAGNDTPDLAIWKHSKKIIIVNASKSLIKKAKKQNPNKEVKVFEKKRKKLKVFLKGIRIHQWSKNALIFAPLFLAHCYTNINALYASFIAFLSFSFCASATYILNDILDVEADRAHYHKKSRPIASGALSIPAALFIMFAFFVIAGVSAAIVDLVLLAYLLIYCAITISYSFVLKRIALVDVLTLSFLYIFRLFYGAQAISTEISFWLVSFSIFFFLSLGFLKRFVEVFDMDRENTKLQSRGYMKADANSIQAMGISSGMLSVLLYIFYVDKGAQELYKNPQYLMYGSMLLVYFICDIWIAAGRKRVHSDPIVYAIKNPKSYVIAVIFLILFVLSSPIVG